MFLWKEEKLSKRGTRVPHQTDPLRFLAESEILKRLKGRKYLAGCKTYKQLFQPGTHESSRADKNLNILFHKL